MTVLIVDDEPPARNLLREYLDEAPEVDVVDACQSGREALAAIATLRPDLVFLDVQMPGLDGFDVLERLHAELPAHALPQIVFSTAHDDYAVNAFETGAADYLLKPYSRARFQQALERARTALRRGEAPSEQLLDVLQEARAQRQLAPPRTPLRAPEPPYRPRRDR